MSDLHLGLIVIGILLVVGVYAFNRFQELQLRRRVESRFTQPDDVLMQDPVAALRDELLRRHANIDGAQPQAELAFPEPVSPEP